VTFIIVIRKVKQKQKKEKKRIFEEKYPFLFIKKKRIKQERKWKMLVVQILKTHVRAGYQQYLQEQQNTFSASS
jgi:hypothetical protein